MLTPTAMQHVTLQVLTDIAPQAALVLAECGVFNPEITPQALAKQLPERPGERYRESVRGAQARLDKILLHCAYEHEGQDAVAAVHDVTATHVVNEAQLEEMDDWLQKVWAKCSEHQEGLRRAEESQKRVDQLVSTLDTFASLDIDLGLLQREKLFLDVRLGTLPADNVPRLQEALAMAGYLLSTFLLTDRNAHSLIAGPTGREKEITAVLQAAGWHAMVIPVEFQGRPASVRTSLRQRRAQIVAEVAAQRELIKTTCTALRKQCVAAQRTLAMAVPFLDVGHALCGRGGLTVITGWVPTRDVPRLHMALLQRFSDWQVLSTRDPRPEERAHVPSVMYTHRLLRPFAALVKTYGIPRYGEIDPTLPFGVTFILMYGMMFGDVGHGAVIALLALALRRTLGDFTFFVVAAGMSSTLFGFLYGSFFGYEHVLPSLWMSPLADPMRMLTLALYWGVGFIVLATLLNIRNRLVDGEVRKALMHRHGVAGLLFYLALLHVAYRVSTGQDLGMFAAVAILLPFTAMLTHVWRENETSLGERLLIVGVEGFEMIINYISNTLSFLRVAAFSLNHVALAIAVFTLANMLNSAGYWVTVVLGNVFIIVLEGAIVAIQVLRLEYYEGFSRFFSGDGRAFRPLVLPNWAASLGEAEPISKG